MKLIAELNPSNLVETEGCVYLNNQYLNGEKVDVVVSKNKVTNYADLLTNAEGIATIVGFTADSDRGKKLIANSVTVGDSVRTPKRDTLTVAIHYLDFAQQIATDEKVKDYIEEAVNLLVNML